MNDTTKFSPDFTGFPPAFYLPSTCLLPAFHSPTSPAASRRHYGSNSMNTPFPFSEPHGGDNMVHHIVFKHYFYDHFRN
jgi:hypothetical protein